MKKVFSVMVILSALLVAGCNRFINPGDSLGGGGTVENVPQTPDITQLVSSFGDIYTQADEYDTLTSAGDNAVCVVFSEEGITVDGVLQTSNTLTISTEGTYVLSGSSSNARVVVNKKVLVHFIFNGLNLTSTESSPFSMLKKAKRVITLAEGTVNSLTDASEYTFFDDDDEPNAALFSKSDLTVNGSGQLTVRGNCNNGLGAKGLLRIIGADITAYGVNNAVKGNDGVIIENAALTVFSEGDGIKSDDEEGGFVYFKDSNVTIQSAEDGIQADKKLWIVNGSFNITTGEGAAANKSSSTPDSRPDWGQTAEEDDTSRKGVKSDADILIEGGAFTLDCYDDAIHSNGTVVIKSGEYDIKSGDDAIHADLTVVINGGNINISASYEGIEGACVVIGGGNIDIVASDDGINAADGTDNAVGVANPNCSIIINGGTISISSGGDGIDSNGTVILNGGAVTVYGPTSGADGALDSDGGILVNGGTLAAGGSLGMVETPATNSAQYVISVAFSSAQSAGTTVTVKNKNGDTVISYTGQKAFQSLILSDSALEKGGEYTVYAGTTKISTITISSAVTTVGTSKGGGFGGRK